MRKTILLAVLGVLLTGTGAWAQYIAGGPHDFSAGSALRNVLADNAAINGQTCVFCHTPHSGGLTIPLWNRSAPTSAYDVYASSTMDAASPGAAGVAAGMSGACMSCHDGSIAIDVLLNLGGAAKAATTTFQRQAGTAKATYGTAGSGAVNIMTGGTPFLGLDLRNDHPITIIYNTAKLATSTEFYQQALSGTKVVVGASAPLPLFGTAVANATVECASCHNPHNNTNAPFLRKSNASSALCLTCHTK